MNISSLEERKSIPLEVKPDQQPAKAKPSHRSKNASKGQPKRQKRPSIPPRTKQDAHPFDNLTKGLFGLDGAEIVSELMTGIKVIDAQNIEIDRSKLKADLVFKILYKGQLAILNLELQTGKGRHVGRRLLQYLAGLHDLYELPVLTAVIYLFRCNPEQQPYRIECVDKKPIIFEYDIICLWEVESQWTIDRKIVPLYVLLPGTKAPTVPLLKQALQEMSQAYERYELEYRLMWFSLILRRTDTMPDADKQTIQEVIENMLTYEEILHDDPIFQRFLAQREQQAKTEGEAEGEARGEARGEAKALKETITSLLATRFPTTLASQAQAVIAPIESVDALKILFRQLLRVPDEQTVRVVLDLPSE
jgi:predicted transposase YdaD